MVFAPDAQVHDLVMSRKIELLVRRCQGIGIRCRRPSTDFFRDPQVLRHLKDLRLQQVSDRLEIPAPSPSFTKNP